MNIFVGLVIGLIEDSYLNILTYSLLWGLVHCIYGYIFRFHVNSLVLSTKGGNPIKSFYIARFLTGIITSFVSSSIILIFRKLFDISSISFGFTIPKIDFIKFYSDYEYLYYIGFILVFLIILDEWILKYFDDYTDFKSTIKKILTTKGAIKKILKETFKNR